VQNCANNTIGGVLARPSPIDIQEPFGKGTKENP